MFSVTAYNQLEACECICSVLILIFSGPLATGGTLFPVHRKEPYATLFPLPNIFLVIVWPRCELSLLGRRLNWPLVAIGLEQKATATAPLPSVRSGQITGTADFLLCSARQAPARSWKEGAEQLYKHVWTSHPRRATPKLSLLDVELTCRRCGSLTPPPPHACVRGQATLSCNIY